MNKRCAAVSVLVLAGVIAGWPAGAARAQDIGDRLAMDPPSLPIGQATLRLTGFVYGGFSSGREAAGPTDPDGYRSSTGFDQGRAELQLQRLYDTGLIVGADAKVLMFHDPLSGDTYGNDTLEKLYLYVQTGLGRIEIGEQDGVGQQIGMTGPVADPHITLENPDTSLFRDPAAGGPFNRYMAEVSTVNVSSNAAKINYLTPRLFGIQLGLSYTPALVKAPLPGLGNAPNAADQQAELVEMAGSYTTYLGRVAWVVTGAFAHGALRNPTPGHTDLYDYAIGTQFVWQPNDWKVTWGGAFRRSNAYGFDPANVYQSAPSRRVQFSLLGQYNDVLLGGEFSFGDIEGPGTVPDITLNGYQLTAGYKPNDNLQLSAGWQWYRYKRAGGTFANGGLRDNMNAGFVTLSYAL